MADKHPRTDDENEDERKKVTTRPDKFEVEQVKAEYTVEFANVNTSQPLNSEPAEQGYATSSPPAQSDFQDSQGRTLNRRFGKLAVPTTQRALLLSGKLKRFDTSSGDWGRVAEQSEASDESDTALLRVRPLRSIPCVDCTDGTGTSRSAPYEPLEKPKPRSAIRTPPKQRLSQSSRRQRTIDQH